MTALLDPLTAAPLAVPVGSVGASRLLRALDQLDLTEHLAEHGPLPALDVDALLGMLDAVKLTGRGGAGFPLATKIRSLRAGAEPVLVVNGA